jgi:hypothetical protein
MIDKIISKLHSLNIPHKHIITYSLCLNAFGLLSLIYGEFLLFIMLFIFSIYLNKIYKEYVKKYSIKNRYIEIYFNFADYIKILTTYAFFSIIYKRKITNNIIYLSIVLLVICNINFTIEDLLFEQTKENNDTYNKIFMKYWNKTMSWIHEDKLKIIYKFTKYFNEIFVICYFVLVMLYIHYK